MSQLRQAVALYESFRERRPHHRLAKLKVDVPKIAVCMGYTDSIDYTTDHAGKLRLYRHKFAKGSRPLLCVSPSGQQLLLLGGRYKWDRRGIVDRDVHGKEIIPPHHARINPADRLKMTPAREYLKKLRERYPEIYAELIDPRHAPYRKGLSAIPLNKSGGKRRGIR